MKNGEYKIEIWIVQHLHVHRHVWELKNVFNNMGMFMKVAVFIALPELCSTEEFVLEAVEKIKFISEH